MITDRYSGSHSIADLEAVQSLEEAVTALALHRPVLDHLGAALERVPDFVAAHAMAGLCHVLTGSAAGQAAATLCAAEARRSLVMCGVPTATERALTEAAELAALGHSKAAAVRLEEHIADRPLELLAAKLAYALRFMTGGSAAMLATTAALLPHWTPARTGYGFLLGCHAFALEENGRLREAEVAGRQACEINAGDVWALHAVAHVLEMRGRSDEGQSWLEPTRRLWARSAGFGLHLAWHLALFRLAAGDVDGALAIYDNDVQPGEPGDFREMMNAASLLWRMEQEGARVGDRWERLLDVARLRARDATYALGSLHDLLVLVAAGDRVEASALLARMRASARQGDGDQPQVMARWALPFADALLASLDGRGVRADLIGLARSMQDLGGSRAQRDVLMRELMVIALRSGGAAMVPAITSERMMQRSFDRFQARLERRMQTLQPMSSRPVLEMAGPVRLEFMA